MLSTLQAITPIFLLVAVGFLLRAVHIVKSSWIKVLNGFVYYISLPALIVYSFTTINRAEPGLLYLVITCALVVVSSAGVIAGIVNVLPLTQKDKSVAYIASVVPNSVYLGVPLVNRVLTHYHVAYNADIVVLISVLLLVGGMLAALIGIEFIFIRSNNTIFIAKKLAGNPLIIAILTGVLFSVMGWPQWLQNTVGTSFSMLAQTASPLALFVLGSFLYGKSLHHKKKLLVLIFAIKLILAPCVAWVIILLFRQHLAISSSSVVVLLSSMPTAVTAFVLSEIYDLDKTTTAAAMLLTTAATIVSVPIVTTLLHL